MIGLECVYRYTQTDNFCFSLCRLCIRKLETRSISWSRKPIGRRTRTQRTNSIKTRHSPRDTEQLFPYSPYWMILKVERRVLSPPPTLLLSKTWWGEDPLLFKKSFLSIKKKEEETWARSLFRVWGLTSTFEINFITSFTMMKTRKEKMRKCQKQKRKTAREKREDKKTKLEWKVATTTVLPKIAERRCSSHSSSGVHILKGERERERKKNGQNWTSLATNTSNRLGRRKRRKEKEK